MMAMKLIRILCLNYGSCNNKVTVIVDRPNVVNALGTVVTFFDVGDDDE